MLGFDFGVVASDELVDSFSEYGSLLAAKTAVLLVEITKSVETGFGFEFLKFGLGTIKDRSDVLSYKSVIVDGVVLEDSQQVKKLREFWPL